jgi:hypothetical protein
MQEVMTTFRKEVLEMSTTVEDRIVREDDGTVHVIVKLPASLSVATHGAQPFPLARYSVSSEGPFIDESDRQSVPSQEEK